MMQFYVQLSQRYEIGDSRPQTSDNSVVPNLSTMVNLSKLKIDSSIGGKSHGKTKVSRIAKSVNHGSNSGNLVSV